MFASQRNPTELLPEHLDAYLAHGWYRMGQGIFTTHFLTFQGDFFSALWLRLPLEGYTFKKRTARLIRQNLARFRCEFHPASIDEEKEALYQLYREDFPAPLSNSLSQSLLNGQNKNIFQTLEFRVYDGQKLVALSYFDLGVNSSASILGIYHPGYKKDSLGFFTMLMEIVYSMERGLHYFYPGYVAPGYPRFDYKLRIGEIEYLSMDKGTWKPYHTLDPSEVPLQKMKDKLRELINTLNEAGIPTHLYYYTLFESNLLGFWPSAFLDYPVIAMVENSTPSMQHYVLVFDPRANQFHLLECTDLSSDTGIVLRKKPNSPHTDMAYFNELLEVKELIGSSSDFETIVSKIRGIQEFSGSN